MNRRSNSKLSLFLMELIIAIFFFAIAGAVSVRLFVSGHLLAEKSVNLDNAVLWSQSLAEAFYGCDGNISEIADLYPNSYIAKEDSMLILFLDDKWELVDNDLVNASYEALLNVAKKEASDVYSDVSDVSSSLTGKAITGKIAVIDVRDGDYVISEIPENEADMIYSLDIDKYLGKEANQ